MTMARLARKNEKYWLAIVPCEFKEFSQEKMEAKASTTDIEWPHAFAQLQVTADEFLESYPCNHIHGITGNYVNEMINVAKILGIDYKVFA
jgi:L-fucose isomerase